MSEVLETRNDKGQFLKGVSGNVAGKPAGTRNRTSMVKEFIEAKLTDELVDDAVDILHVAIKKAKSGDNAMIKLILGDLLSEARGEAKGVSGGTVNLTVTNMTTEPTKIVIDHEESNE